MNIPSELKHKPVIVAEDYDRIDGRLSGKSDAKGLSLGLAQWNDRGRLDISAKVWRYSGKRWSRQSEELPLHRVLDLAILICRTRLFFRERYHKNEKDHKDYPLLDRLGLQGDAMNVAVALANENLEEDMEIFDLCLHEDDEIIGERLRLLASLIQEMGI